VAFIDHPFRQTFRRMKRSKERQDIRLATQQHFELKDTFTFLTAVNTHGNSGEIVFSSV